MSNVYSAAKVVNKIEKRKFSFCCLLVYIMLCMINRNLQIIITTYLYILYNYIITYKNFIKYLIIYFTN